jgi:hypothetical protein
VTRAERRLLNQTIAKAREQGAARERERIIGLLARHALDRIDLGPLMAPPPPPSGDVATAAPAGDDDDEPALPWEHGDGEDEYPDDAD